MTRGRPKNKRNCRYCGDKFQPSGNKQRHCSPTCSFWNKVDIAGSNDCWEWQSGRMESGYGRFAYNGEMKLAHRISWKLANEEIPEGLCVLHKCDNPPCVNPAHLWVGTQIDNIDDMVVKERNNILHADGEDNPVSVLTEEFVTEIRKRFEEGDITHGQLAKEYNTRRRHVGKIINRKIWNHI